MTAIGESLGMYNQKVRRHVKKIEEALAQGATLENIGIDVLAHAKGLNRSFLPEVQDLLEDLFLLFQLNGCSIRTEEAIYLIGETVRALHPNDERFKPDERGEAWYPGRIGVKRFRERASENFECRFGVHVDPMDLHTLKVENVDEWFNRIYIPQLIQAELAHRDEEEQVQVQKHAKHFVMTAQIKKVYLPASIDLKLKKKQKSAKGETDKRCVEAYLVLLAGADGEVGPRYVVFDEKTMKRKEHEGRFDDMKLGESVRVSSRYLYVPEEAEGDDGKTLWYLYNQSTRVCFTSNGKMSVHSFHDWCRTLVMAEVRRRRRVFDKKKQAAVLIIDADSALLSPQALKMLKEDNIRVVSIVKNCAEVMLPLNHVVAGGCKVRTVDVLTNRILHSTYKKVKGDDRLWFPPEASVQYCTEEQLPALIRSSFKAVGMLPVNSEPSLTRMREVMDRIQPKSVVVEGKEYLNTQKQLEDVRYRLLFALQWFIKASFLGENVGRTLRTENLRLPREERWIGLKEVKARADEFEALLVNDSMMEERLQKKKEYRQKLVDAFEFFYTAHLGFIRHEQGQEEAGEGGSEREAEVELERCSEFGKALFAGAGEYILPTAKTGRKHTKWVGTKLEKGIHLTDETFL
mmetsp:Transcript_16952/g.42568  ORF Transcript_16952/g.42568 Transcript_16952/m.42568 type:complete len:632 (-) Transcript_16952:75-1970(-)